MEYVYAALLLHSAGKEITEENVKAVLQAAGVNINEARIKALVSALEEVNIDEAISKASLTFAGPAPAPAQAVEEKKEEEKKEEEKKKEEEEKEEEVLEGLGALFG